MTLMSKTNPNLLDRYHGALLGLACGDAVGTTVEFRGRGTFEPVTDMVGGGPFHLAPGQWTDDTSMALCLAESLLELGGFDAQDQMRRYVRWWREGYLSATGECFDIGMTTRRALASFEANGHPFAGDPDPQTAGNGSLMRLAPVVLFCYPDLEQAVTFAADSSRTTHAAPEAVDCCRLLAVALVRALSGWDKAHFLDHSEAFLTEPAVRRIAQGPYLGKTAAQIQGSGYCVASVEASLWCLTATTDFRGAVLAAANLGDDADTTAAITGQLAGALYGLQGIPEAWRERVHLGERICDYARRLWAIRAGQTGSE